RRRGRAHGAGGNVRRRLTLDGSASRKACPHPSPLPQAGEGGRSDQSRSGPLSLWERVRVRAPRASRQTQSFQQAFEAEGEAEVGGGVGVVHRGEEVCLLEIEALRVVFEQ